MKVSTVSLDQIGIACGFASEFGVDIVPDITRSNAMTPVLAQLDGIGRPLVHIAADSGEDYYISRIDYAQSNRSVRSSRLIMMVMPGYRTHLAYRVAKANTDQRLTVHRGAGYLIIGDPDKTAPGEAITTSNITMYRLDPNVTPEITIPAGKFYTIEATDWSEEPLVVSGLYETNLRGTIRNPEIVLEPGVEMMPTADGRIQVPEEFVTANFE